MVCAPPDGGACSIAPQNRPITRCSCSTRKAGTSSSWSWRSRAVAPTPPFDDSVAACDKAQRSPLATDLFERPLSRFEEGRLFESLFQARRQGEPRRTDDPRPAQPSRWNDAQPDAATEICVSSEIIVNTTG